MVKKGTILFDIDRTLLDTDKASSLHEEAVLKVLGTSDLEKIKSIKLNYRNTLSNEREYKAEDFLKILADELKFDRINDLMDVYYSEKYAFTYANAVFPEVIPVLDALSVNYNLGIYSEGANKFQNNKFRSMNISKYFDEEIIFIVPAKDTLEVIKKIPKGSIVIDDKERICEFLTSNGIEAIWLNNKGDRKSDNFKTIFSLLELPAIL